MAYPTQSPWDGFYWDETTISTVLDPVTGLSFSGASVTGDELVIDSAATGSYYSYVSGTVSPGDTSTVEFLVKFIALPISTYSVKLLVGKNSTFAAELLFQRGGITTTFVDASGSPTTYTFPSSGVDLDVWYRIRYVVDDDLHSKLYVTPEEEVKYGYNLVAEGFGTRHTSFISDTVALECRGSASEQVKIAVRALMFAETAKVIPVDPPRAHISCPVELGADQLIVLDGRDTEAPAGATLDYRWSVIEVPGGSDYLFSGLASTDSVDPRVLRFDHDLPETLGGGDVVTILGYGQTTVNPGSFDAGGKLVNPRAIRIDDDLGLSAGTGGLPVSIYARSLIADPTAALTYASPDAVGVYRFRLVVSDPASGFEDSVDRVVVIKESTLLPTSPLDLSWIWRLIGSQWNQVEDRQVIQALWEAMSLAGSGWLLSSWETAASKSLATIPRQYVRSWWKLLTTVDRQVTGEPVYDDRVWPIYLDVPSPGVNVAAKLLVVYVEGTRYEVVFSGPDPVSVEDVTAEINAVVPGLAQQQGDVVRLSSAVPILLEGDSLAQFGLSDPAYSVWELPATVTSQKTVTVVTHCEVKTLAPEWAGIQETGGLHRVTTVLNTAANTYVITLDDDFTTPVGSSVTLTIAPTLTMVTFDPGVLRLGPPDVLVYSLDGGQEAEDVTLQARYEVISYRPEVGPRHGFSGAHYRRIEKRDRIPVYPEVTRIPQIVSAPEEAEYIYKQGRDYEVVRDGVNTSWVEFVGGGQLAAGVRGWWAPRLYLDASPTIWDNFGSMIGVPPDKVGPADYLDVITRLWEILFGGPAADPAGEAVALLAGLPVVFRQGVIVDIQPGFTPDYGRILIQEESGEVVSYFWPEHAVLGTNPETGVEWAVGDDVPAGTRLCPVGAGVEDIYGGNYVNPGPVDYHRLHLWVDEWVSPVVGVVKSIRDFFAGFKPAWARMELNPSHQVDDVLAIADTFVVGGMVVFNEVVGQLVWNSVGAVPVFGDHDGGTKWRSVFAPVAADARRVDIIADETSTATTNRPWGAGAPFLVSKLFPAMYVGDVFDYRTLWIECDEYGYAPPEEISVLADYEASDVKEFHYCNRRDESVAVTEAPASGGGILHAGTHRYGSYGLRIDGGSGARSELQYANLILNPDSWQVSVDIYTGGKNTEIIAVVDASGNDVFTLSWWPTSPKFSFTVTYADATTANTTGSYSATGWIHVALAYSGGVVKVYADGTQVLSFTLTKAINDPQDVYLLAETGVTNIYFDQFMYFAEDIGGTELIRWHSAPVRFRGTALTVSDLITQINTRYPALTKPFGDAGSITGLYIQPQVPEFTPGGTAVELLGWRPTLVTASAVKEDPDDLAMKHEFYVGAARVY